MKCVGILKWLIIQFFRITLVSDFTAGFTIYKERFIELYGLDHALLPHRYLSL